MSDGGFSDARLKKLGEGLTPNSSAIVAVIEYTWVADVERAMAEAGADVVTEGLSADIAKQLSEGGQVAYTLTESDVGLEASRIAVSDKKIETIWWQPVKARRRLRLQQRLRPKKRSRPTKPRARFTHEVIARWISCSEIQRASFVSVDCSLSPTPHSQSRTLQAGPHGKESGLATTCCETTFSIGCSYSIVKPTVNGGSPADR